MHVMHPHETFPCSQLHEEVTTQQILMCLLHFTELTCLQQLSSLLLPIAIMVSELMNATVSMDGMETMSKR
jgi:hypothetical protein